MDQNQEHAKTDCLLGNTWKYFTYRIMENLHHLEFAPMYNITLLELSLPTARRVSRVGYILSLSTLIVSFCILFGIRVLRSRRNKLHLHLFITFMLRALMFLAEDSGLLNGSQDDGDRFINADVELIELKGSNTRSSFGCKIYVAFWLYSIMANYSWILIEGLYLHNLIFLALLAPPLSTIRYIVLGWSFPLPFLIGWIVVSDTSENMLCWTETKNPDYFWIIRGPITISIIANFILFLNITRSIYVKTFAPQTPRHCRYRKLFRSTLILLPLFGVHYTITTVISIILEKKQKDELTWLLVDQIFSSFQGCVVSLLYCFLNSEVQSALWGVWIKWKTTYGHMFQKPTGRCRKHSRTRLNTPDTGNSMTGRSGISSFSRHCRFCAQESHEIELCKSQETVVSFFDLEAKEMEEGTMNNDHENSLGINSIQETFQVDETSRIPINLQSNIAVADDVTSSGAQMATTPLLQPTKSPFFNPSNDENIVKGASIELKCNIILDLERTVHEGNQASASANDVLFLLHAQDTKNDSHLNSVCYCETIAEESSLESAEEKKETEISSHCQHLTDTSACCRLKAHESLNCIPVPCYADDFPQLIRDNSQECAKSCKLLHDCENNDTQAMNKNICECHKAQMKMLKDHSSCNLKNLQKFCCVITDLSALSAGTTTSARGTFDDTIVIPKDGGTPSLNTKGEFPEFYKRSMSLLCPPSDEEQSTSILSDSNDHKHQLSDKKSTSWYRRRSSSEGARWLCSIRKTKVSLTPPEWIESKKSDPSIDDRNQKCVSIPLCSGFEAQTNVSKENPAVELQSCSMKPKTTHSSDGTVCMEHYNQLKAASKIEHIKQNFRPRSSSDCRNIRSYRRREVSPRIPPEWMQENLSSPEFTKIHRPSSSAESFQQHTENIRRTRVEDEISDKQDIDFQNARLHMHQLSSVGQNGNRTLGKLTFSTSHFSESSNCTHSEPKSA